MHGRYRSLLKEGETITTRGGVTVRPEEVLALQSRYMLVRETSLHMICLLTSTLLGIHQALHFPQPSAVPVVHKCNVAAF